MKPDSAWESRPGFCFAVLSEAFGKALKPGILGAFEEVGGCWLWGQGFVLENSERVGHDEALGGGFAEAFGEGGVGFAEAGVAAGEVVGVAADEVNPVIFEKLPGDAFGDFAKGAGEGAGGDLDEEVGAEPFAEVGTGALEGAVAFGVGEDGREAGDAELIKDFVHARRDAGVGEFD